MAEHIIIAQWFGMCLKQTDEHRLYRYLPSLDNGCAGGPKSQSGQKMPGLPDCGGILMVMRLSATTLVSVVPLLVSVSLFS